MGPPNNRAPAIGLSVVVPTYNERDHIEDLIDRICDAWNNSPEAAATGAIEIVVVDDNSPDGTGQYADAIARRRPVRVVHRAGKQGLGTAVKAGFEVAQGRLIAVMDADLSHPPHLLPRLVRTLRETHADFVVASRYVSGGANDDWLLRRVMSRTACTAARVLTPVRDAMSGFFVLEAERAKSARTVARGFKILLELIVRTSPKTVVELPYGFVGRTAGKSKMNLAEAMGFLKQLWDLSRFNAGRGAGRPRHLVAAAPSPDAADAGARYKVGVVDVNSPRS
jgi:dolichol-phosphate mannosyltransferase